MSRTWMPRVAGWLLPVLLAVASGCIRLPEFKSSKQSITFYSLEYAPPVPARSEPLGGIVLVRRLIAASLYGTDRIVTQGPLYTTEFSYYKRWAASPSSMITDLLYRDLCESGLFDAVLNGPGFLRPVYEVSGTLETMEARRRSGEWETELVVNVLCFPYSADKSSPAVYRLFQKRYHITTPSSDGTAEAIAASMSQCVRDFTGQLIQDLTAYLQRSGCPPPSAPPKSAPR